MSAERIAKLSEAQRACLRRVFAHQTSKDIARELGISPHTVDQRLRTAARILGVAGRIDAARVLAAVESGEESYQPIAYQPPAIATGDDIPSSERTTTEDEDDIEFAFGDHIRERQLAYQAFVPDISRSLPRSLPFPTSPEDENTLPAWQRLMWVVAIAIAAALSFGAILSGLEALSSLFAHQAG